MKNRNKKTIMSIALAAAMVSSMVASTALSVSAEETVTPDTSTSEDVQDTGLAITTQPTSYTGSVGDTANFEIEASGENVTYQWQVDTGNGEWTNIEEGTNQTFSVQLGEDNLSYKYRCVISDGAEETITSDEVQLLLKETGDTTEDDGDSTTGDGDTTTNDNDTTEDDSDTDTGDGNTTDDNDTITGDDTTTEEDSTTDGGTTGDDETVDDEPIADEESPVEDEEPVEDEKPSEDSSDSITPPASYVSSASIAETANKVTFTDDSGNQMTGTIVAFTKQIEDAKENTSFAFNIGKTNLIFKTSIMEKLIANKGTLNVTYKDVKFVVKGGEFKTVKVVNLEKILHSSECQKILKTAKTIVITSDANGELVLAGE